MPTRKQLIERWQNAERVLKALTPHQRKKHFDMATFGYETVCGTVACAAGYCGLDPWFRRRGFRTDLTTDNFEFVQNDLSGIGPLHPLDARHLRLDWSRETPRGFFGGGAETIFYNPRRRSVGQVIREIRAHIKALQSEGDGRRE